MAPPDNPASVYLDSDALIRVIKADPGHQPVAELLRRADTGQLTVVISTLSLVEVRGGPLIEPVSSEVERRCLATLDNPRLRQVEFYRDVALRARRYAQTYGMKNPDAIHLASAVEAEADVLMTFDQRFQSKRRVDGVWISEPYVPGGDPLPGI